MKILLLLPLMIIMGCSPNPAKPTLNITPYLLQKCEPLELLESDKMEELASKLVINAGIYKQCAAKQDALSTAIKDSEIKVKAPK